MVTKGPSLSERIAQAASRRSNAAEKTEPGAPADGVFYGKTPDETGTLPTKQLAKTGPGAMIQHLQESSAVHQENQQLKDQLAQWDGANPARKISAELVIPSKYANRDESSFTGTEFKDFKVEIESAGGNIQPIKVRPIPGSDKFEIIFGHRRHRACKELGIPVLVLIEQATELELFEQMDRENRQRADLRPYEQGEMYRRALHDKLYPSLRSLCAATGANLGNASVAIRIAQMPVEVLKAFDSPLDIQFRWGKPLADAVDSSPDVVIEIARTIAIERGNKDLAGEPAFKPTDIFERLIAKPGGSTEGVREVPWGSKAPMKIKHKGDKFSLAISGVPVEKAAAIEAAVLKILKG